MDSPEPKIPGAVASHPSDSDSSSDSGADDEQPTQWLATARQRRSTAGNRMKSMLANEEPDSDLELLFAEDENDQGFEDADEDASDVQMDSSDDDDDDDDNNANPDDLEGEKELERRAKEQRLANRKRKARDAIPPKFRKKVRIDPTTPAAPPPRPKKKSERTSWLPSPADLPTRSSSRKTTRISKEHLHRQMVEREARRLKQLALMQKKAARLEALKKPPMSQAERLAEAALVEKRNSKSLNRWEEAEKQREEDRRARLAALNNRTLNGPVITFWSGVREWKDALGQHVTLVEAKPKRKRERVDKGSKTEDKGMGHGGGGDKNAIAPEGQTPKGDDNAISAKDAAPPPRSEAGGADRPEKAPVTKTSTTPASNQQGKQGQQGPTQGRPMDTETHGSASQLPPSVLEQEETGRLMAMPAPPPPPPPLPAPSGGLAAPAPLSSSLGGLATPSGAVSRPPDARPSSVLAAPVLAPPPGMDMTMDRARPTNVPKSGVLAPPDTSQHHPPPPPPVQGRPSERPVAVAASPSTEFKPSHASCETQPQPRAAPGEATPACKSASPSGGGALGAAPQPPESARGSTTTARNAIIFRSFDQNAIRDKTVQTQILFGRKMTRLSKPTPAAHCVITDHPARYRDPKTGLPYYNAFAYREIQRLHRGDYRWSRLLGAWVGSGTLAARGVPDRFLCPEPEEARRRRMEEKAKAKEEEILSKVQRQETKPEQPSPAAEEANAPAAAAGTDPAAKSAAMTAAAAPSPTGDSKGATGTAQQPG
ncbi:YL1 nuclear protein [Hirsutella rhossiliensis]|uniref:YL1 nuclear protein n=1 Tax=Hirsutella rhossiliensis TaxID=111463 RepID=A0A9P8SG39_9HYPO|nr:YL1 nuclear protein [Hirsutella rhossiliensis]KAH0960035.1 YL1 nuclear protein [Hirsutella rhossiliensis]